MQSHGDIQNLIKGLSSKFMIDKIILFGSQASNDATENSDIDICIIADVSERRKFLKQLRLYIYDKYSGLNFNKPVDIIFYTPDDWAKNFNKSGTFANLIAKEGVFLYGRQ